MKPKLMSLYKQAMDFSGDTGTTHFEFMIFVDKFAELVVEECASMVQDCVDRRVPASEYPDHLKQLLRNR